MTCSSGPPCWPGNTAELIFFAYSSRHRIRPPRAPPSVLCTVVVTTSAYGHRVGVDPGGDEPGEVGHVDHQEGADLVGDLPEAREVEHARVGRPAGEQQLRPALLGDPLDLVHVDQVGLGRDLVGRDVVQPARHVDLHAVAEVAAVRQREAHDRVAGLQQRVVDGRVGLRAGVRLHVGVLGAEQRLGAVDRELLDHVDVLAAAVVALARIALGVLVREHAALALEDRLGHEVLRRDHLERALLALELAADRLGDLGIDVGQRALEVVRLQLGHPRTVPTASSGNGPLPHDRPGAVRLVAAQVDHGRRRARQRRRRRARGRRPRGSRAGTSCEPPRVGAAGVVGGALQHRRARRRRAPAGRGTRSPSVSGSGPQASGKRRCGLGSSSVTPPGSSPSSARAQPRPELGQRGQRGGEREEHDRGGLVGRPPLQRVQPRDRGGATRGRTRARRPCRRGRRRRRRRRSSSANAAARRSGPASRHGGRRGRGRCRRGRGTTRDLGEARVAHRRARPPRPGPGRSRARRARAPVAPTSGSSRPMTSSPSGPARSASAGS